MAAAPQTLTREELHELVWETPMRRLAERFGISEVGLAAYLDQWPSTHSH